MRCINCVYSGDLGAPPAAPSDDITYILYTARSYTLSINFTSAPLEIAYVVQLITNATDTTSYFFVLPVCFSGILVSSILVKVRIHNSLVHTCVINMHTCICVL